MFTVKEVLSDCIRTKSDHMNINMNLLNNLTKTSLTANKLHIFVNCISDSSEVWPMLFTSLESFLSGVEDHRSFCTR